MAIFPFLHWPRRKHPGAPQTKNPETAHLPTEHAAASPLPQLYDVHRHFYNERGFQCFASFFPLWGGWATAGHVLTEAGHIWPEFTHCDGENHTWPGGLDAALAGCQLPDQPPESPKAGQTVIACGYPAGSRTLESRHGTTYIERQSGSGTWIAHIKTPDEPVVSGMSGGPVIDAETGQPIGILITRNSPADLNADRDPDESCDFVSLRAVWNALNKSNTS